MMFRPIIVRNLIDLYRIHDLLLRQILDFFNRIWDFQRLLRWWRRLWLYTGIL